MTHNRERIHEFLQANPGVHFSGLRRELDLAPGQAQYHLRRLDDAGRILAEQLYGRTHYYPHGYGAWERGTLALLRRETSRDVVAALLEYEPADPATVAEAVGIARSTLEWHLDRLCERDLVEKHRNERGRVTLALTRPRETARLLETVVPSLPDRAVDRFVRLVDGLFSEPVPRD